jgi:hypothetical protein
MGAGDALRIEAMTKPRRTTCEEAFTVFCGLGPARNLPMLLAHYKADPETQAPSKATLKNWSSKSEWQARAAEHDRQVSEATHDRLVEEQAAARADMALKFDLVAIKALEKVSDSLEALKVTSPEEAERFVKLACLASGEAREIVKGKHAKNAIAEMANELEKQEGQGTVWASQLREITSGGASG